MMMFDYYEKVKRRKRERPRFRKALLFLCSLLFLAQQDMTVPKTVQ